MALQPIETFTAEELKYAIKDNITDKANIKTDSFPSYKKIAKHMANITLSYSEKGAVMKELHKQVMLFKNWLRGTHHKCSKEYLFAYSDEYEYRFTKRNMRTWIFNDDVVRLMNQIPHPYNHLKTLCVYST